MSPRFSPSSSPGRYFAQFRISVHFGVRFGKIDVHDIAELLLGEIGYADRRVLSFHAHPSMLAMILDIVWIHLTPPAG